MSKEVYSIISKESFEQNFIASLSIIKDFLRKMGQGHLAFKFDNAVQSVSPTDAIRLFKELNSANNFEKSSSNVILNTLLESDFRSKGSDILALIVFVEIYPALLRLKRSGMTAKDLEKFEKDFILTVNKSLSRSRRVNSKSAVKCVKNILRDSDIHEIFEKALKTAGACGVINIEKTDSENSEVVKTEGFRFKICLDPIFLESVSFKEISFENPKIVVIDGIIEKYDEIERLIEFSHKEKRPLVLFARGFNPEISSNLAANYNSKIVDVIPVTVNFDEMGANQLVDIAICACTDVVSSLKGQDIKEINWDTMTSVEKIIISRKSLTIKNSTAQDRCLLQKDKLIKQLGTNIEQDEKIETMRRKILNERINSITPSITNIFVGKNFKDLQGIKYDRMCKSFELYNEISRWGLVDISLKTESTILNRIFRNMSQMRIDEVSPRALATAIKISFSNARSMLSVGACLKNEAT